MTKPTTPQAPLLPDAEHVDWTGSGKTITSAVLTLDQAELIIAISREILEAWAAEGARKAKEMKR